MATTFILGIVALALAIQCCRVDAESANPWEEYKLVPNIIPSPPESTAKVEYKDGEANLGNLLTPTQVHDKPIVKYPSEDGVYYTLFLSDIDIPRILVTEFTHWLVLNIPGSEISKGDTVFDYVAPNPPAGTGPHRYILFIYKQNGLIPKEKFSNLKTFESFNRLHFKRIDMMKRFGFKNPVAGNFFRSQHKTISNSSADPGQKFGKKKLFGSFRRL